MKTVFTLLVILNIVVLGIVSYMWIWSDKKAAPVRGNGSASNLKKFSTAQLAKYNGVDPTLPIYIGLDGFVYDVTKGKDFYKVGGPYHDLAGRDASSELHLVGGGIIKRKYPIVGRL